MSKPPTPIRAELYSHSPAHLAVSLRDHSSLTRLVSSLPTLPDPARIRTESDSLSQERLADEISSVLDRRDVPFRETPLHLAVRLNDAVAVQTLADAGADVSLQNDAGWNPLQDALCRRLPEVSRILVRQHHLAAWAKWRRRLPRLIGALRRMRDFYMEIQFHFESSFVPFIGKIAPSDTYRIWKRDGNLRADTSLAGFDGMKIQRADQSFLFLGDGDYEHDIPEGSLLVLNRDDRKIFDAFENAGAPMTEDDVAGFCSQTSVYRPGMDVTKAELVGRTNWRRQEKTESVGEWKAKVYEVHNVVFSFRSRKVGSSSSGENDGVLGGGGRREEQVLPLELDEQDDFLVAENPADLGMGFAADENGHGRRHSSFVREREWVSVGRKSVDINFAPPPPPAKITAGRRSVDVNFAPPPAKVTAGRKSVDMNFAPPAKMTAGRRSVDIHFAPPPAKVTAGRKSVDFSFAPPETAGRKSVDLSIAPERRSATSTSRVTAPLPPPSPVGAGMKEKEYVKSLRPSVWLTEEFPLKTEEMLPLLDILANKVKAVRRMRELLTTKFPPGTFPVKIAIPVVPTVRVVITFTKFVQLQPTEVFYTPMSSPRFLSNGDSSPPEEQPESRHSSWSTSSASSWLRRSNSSKSGNKQQQPCPEALEADPFAIPSGYTWESIDTKNRKMKKSKSVRRSK